CISLLSSVSPSTLRFCKNKRLSFSEQCGYRQHPQCMPMCQPIAAVLPVRAGFRRAVPRQATACQDLVAVIPGAKHKETWRLTPTSAFGGKAQADVNINSNVRFWG